MRLINANEAENRIVAKYKDVQDGCNDWINGYNEGLSDAQDIILELYDHSTVDEWIPVSERLPEEHEWIGTKEFGTTISDTVLITFDVGETRFVKPMMLQNGELSRADKNTMDVFYKGWKMIAWMLVPEPYNAG